MDKSQSMIPHVIYRFKEIWSNIHLYPVDQQNASQEEPKLETVNGDSTRAEELLPLDARWYAKAPLLIDNVNNFLGHLCRWPGFAMSIDKTMKKFKGISKTKKWMKNKPVKKG